MEQAHLEARAANGEFQQDELYKLGMGKLKLLLLDELAISKGNAVAHARAAQAGGPVVLETVEFALAYRVFLAERLALPVKTQGMLYFAANTGMTEQDLAEAVEEVNRMIADKGRVARFMAGWSPWQAELKRLHPEDFSAQALSEAKDRLYREMEEVLVSYQKFEKEEGEDSINTWNAKRESNRLKQEFDTLEADALRKPTERLTKAYMEAMA